MQYLILDILPSVKNSSTHYRKQQTFTVNQYENRVRGILGEYNLSKSDVEKAVKECYRVLKRERLISR